MKKLLLVLTITISIYGCVNKDAAPEPVTPAPPALNPNDTLVKFTLYSKRTPYIWKRMVNNSWVQDTIKTNSAVRYEPFVTANFGIGYWVTMNLAGISTDSLHITGEYRNKITQMTSLKYQSAAYVLLDNLK